jgi:probable F420-dependent oxidoreductase
MKFGLVPVNVGVKSIDHIIGISQLAESVGMESVWTFEHVMVPEDYSSKYPYSADGKMGAGPETNFVDPLIALTAVAANTKTLRLGTGVNIVSQANPLLLAKQAASLDFVSGGRFMLGAGIGWLREEFDAMGVPFERRGARFDDYMIALRKVWSGDVVEHQSDFINWSGFKSYPIPRAEGGIPVIMGGTKGKIYERVARHGDGWFLPVASPEELQPVLEPLAAACEAIGRDPATVEISCMWNMKGGLDDIKAFEEVGASRVIVPIFALGKDPVAGLSQLAETVISKL